MNFTCNHCGMIQIVTRDCKNVFSRPISIGACAEIEGGKLNGELGASVLGIRCANPECNRASVYVSLGIVYYDGNYSIDKNSIFQNNLIYPKPAGKPFPNSVPDQFIKDYREAWAIINLSPKSSATLARRCLQGMIRDFCGIHERTLFHEIEKLEEKLAADELPKGVDIETIEAMRALKDVGNIGAHMTEIDGTIVDVDPGEAEALLGLIEMIFNDWYVARDKRRKQLDEIVALAAAKKLK